FNMADPIRSTTPAAIQSLQNLGIDLELLTGDHPEAARVVATQLGIARVQAGVSWPRRHGRRWHQRRTRPRLRRSRNFIGLRYRRRKRSCRRRRA
ncbi:MAG: HAD family hydrolase, partial [Verrucomicrobia bacterium]|nr:HAD family hydrolase [Verrucomicrobiota bacterium]